MQHDPTSWPPTPYGADKIKDTQVTIEELVAVTKRLKVKEASGSYGIPNESQKTVIQEFWDMFRTVL